MTATPTLTAWITAYAAQAAQDDAVADFVARVDGEILASLPDLDVDPVLLAELHASTRAHWVTFLAGLADPNQELHLPAQARALALSLARRRHDIGVLLKIYRVGGRAVWDFVATLARELPDDSELSPTEVLVYFWDRAGTWIDDAVEVLLQVFDDERQRLLDEAMARRADTIRAILAGHVNEADAASTELGHPLLQQNTAIAVWVDDDDSTADTDDSLQRMAAAIASAVGATRPLMMAVSSRCIWAWVATRSRPDLSALAPAVESQPDRIRVAVGSPSPGLDGFRQSHREAVQAMRLTMASGSERRLTQYADVELIALTADHRDAMHALVARELGELAGTAANLEPVRSALLHYLRLGASVEATADLLHVHKNTVRYRLARAEELIGRPLTEGRASLELALRFVEEFGATEL